METAISPNGGGAALVLKLIYAARRRDIDVRVVVDEKGNKSKLAAPNLPANVSIQARTNGKYAIHHDKYIIVDDLHVQTDSFSYSRAAAKSNSENVLVVWHYPALIAAYICHRNVTARSEFATTIAKH